MATILSMYITLMPVIFAGVTNMAFCKSDIFISAYYPIDNYRLLNDGKRLFGDNKTWKGFFGMIFFTLHYQIIWGLLFYLLPSMGKWHFIYQTLNNTLQLNVRLGFWLGLAYVIFELPNSFIKRRLDIEPGKTADTRFRWLFILLDQADSIIGCVLVIALYVSLSLGQIIVYILLGSITHIIINRILFFIGLRQNRY